MHQTREVRITDTIFTHVGQYYDDGPNTEKWFVSGYPYPENIGNKTVLPSRNSAFNRVFGLNSNIPFDTADEAEAYVRKQVKANCFEILKQMETK